MKLLTLLSVVVVGVSGYLFKLPILPAPPKIANSDWIHRQKLVLSLFENVCDISTDPAIVHSAQDFDLDTATGNFEDQNVIVRLKALISQTGLLAKGEIFTEYNPTHIEELQVISDVLCTAQDFHTFYISAAWARQNVNCGLFVDAIYLAIMKRRDTENLSIPAPYELMPNYFINKNTILTATSLLSNVPIELGDNVRNDGNAYIIDANYTSDIYENYDETKLAYFHEDIGLNTYYMLKKLSKLSSVKDARGFDRHGEYIYHVMKQLATRYDLERYANGFTEVQGIDWNMLDSSSYDSMLVYSNGQDFNVRPRNLKLKSPQDIVYLKNIENSITTNVNHMIQSGFDKNQILNNLMEILVTGDKNYKDIAHQLLGTDINNVETTPTVLDHFMTSLRDPIFWKLNKKIVNIIDDAFSIVPSYTKSELFFPGVKVVKVDIKKMSTSFDTFEFDITGALNLPDRDSTFQIKIAQPRLNHKPFSIKVNITSLVPQKGLLKVFLGPKMLPGELALKRGQFMLLDTCEITLKKGGNIITRTSEEISNLSPDFLSLKALHQNLEDAEFGIANLPMENIPKLIGFPSRLIIPKGTEEGLPLQIFIFVAPFAKVNIATSVTEFNSAILSPTYPLDLTLNDNQLYDLPNAIVKEVIVTHKGISRGKYEGGKGKNWDGEAYDYTARKGQYAQKVNFAEKLTEQKPVQQYLETEDPATVKEPNTYLLQMRPNRLPFDYTSKQKYGKRTEYASGRIYKSPTFNKEQVTASDKPRGMLEKKPININMSKYVNEYTKDSNGAVNVINISKNKDKVMTTESNKVSYIDIEKDNNNGFIDNNKVVKINIDKEKIFFNEITDKYNMKNYESIDPREKVHEDIAEKYFIPKLEQEPQSTKRIPTVYDYIVNGYDDFDFDQPKVYE